MKKLIVILTAIILIITITARKAQSREPVHYTKYTVQQGDTLWSIAKQYGTHSDIRKDIYVIEKVNHCNADVQPGQTLIISIK